jgi:hypothetical protein
MGMASKGKMKKMARKSLPMEGVSESVAIAQARARRRNPDRVGTDTRVPSQKEFAKMRNERERYPNYHKHLDEVHENFKKYKK